MARRAKCISRYEGWSLQGKVPSIKPRCFRGSGQPCRALSRCRCLPYHTLQQTTTCQNALAWWLSGEQGNTSRQCRPGQKA